MTTVCGVSGTKPCCTASIVTISPIYVWYRFHSCIIYLFVFDVNVIFGTGPIIKCKKIKVKFMHFAQNRPFCFFSLLFLPFDL